MGYFPLLFKNSILILIPKPEKDPRKAINYIPISLLEVPGKIFQRIIKDRLTRFLEEGDNLNP